MALSRRPNPSHLERLSCPTWAISVLPGWSAVQHPECLTITPHDESSAFQLSASRKKSGIVTHEDLAAMAADSYGKPAQAALGQFTGLSVAYEEGGICWRRFWLAHDNLLIFATYNGSRAALRRQEHEVLFMLNTLEHQDG